MTKTELNEALQFLQNPQGDLQIILYALLDGENDPKKLDIKADDLPPIHELFVSYIKQSIIDKDEYSVLPLSTADERKNCFYAYDLELPNEFELLSSVIGNDEINNFNFGDNQLSQVKSLIVVLADEDTEISLFKKLSPVEVIGRGGLIFGKARASERLERFDDQLLRMSPRFQVIRVNEEIIITDLAAIERSFGFHDVIEREAIAGLDTIREIALVSNLETLEELVSDISFARKLTRIARSSPVIQHQIPNSNIIAFSKLHPATRNRMRYNADETQFTLDTRVSKDLFMKILNDDLLTSELTKLYYDSLAKDGISVEEETENTEAIEETASA
ncbi:anti-phage protein KwaB [Marinoscillum pacificum]|uniref:anti-phage protein KwaB n=1 Tax=Marinoscillum pacificum TaxID=392723 RepID=UPI0021579260|nr:anti-phage protein KwaB [Marinoscillum pacificum]